MDNAAIQPGIPPGKIAESVQAGAPQPKPAEPITPSVVLHWMADLRITVVLFALAMLIVFWGTLAQVDHGVWIVVSKYFRSILVMVPLRVILFNSIPAEENPLSIPFPGGWLVGGAMMINLLAAHAVRFKLTWARAGILLTHAGLIVMMIGELVTGIYAVEGSMIIKTGDTCNTIIDARNAELAIVRRLDNKKDQITTIPARLLREPGNVVEHDDLPFKVEAVEYYLNSNLIQGNEHNRHKHKNRATHGYGKFLEYIAIKEPEVSGVDQSQRNDYPSTYVKFIGKKGENLGTWMFTCLLNDDDGQTIIVDGVKYDIVLRFKQTVRPNVKFHLTQFDYKVYPGTQTPKDFRSHIHLVDTETGVDRKVEIYMNNPLYYRGETYYQASWQPDPMNPRKAVGTTLSVVHNPGWLMPYISCAMVGVGLLAHFGLTLYRFLERRAKR